MADQVSTLARLTLGQSAVITALRAPEEERARLAALGFVPGEVVSVVQESPWGDPVAYAVCGAVIALRRADSRKVEVEAKINFRC